MDFTLLTNKAIEAAVAAGKLINAYMNDDILVEKKTGSASYAAQVVTEVDIEFESIIREHLGPISETFDLAILSEETIDDGSRLLKDYFWCIDPMDGTLAFINKQPGFSVSIALVAKDGTPCIGVVYDPIGDTVFHAVKGHGAFKNNLPLILEHNNSFLTYVTDKTLAETPQAAVIQGLLDDYLQQLELETVKVLSGGGSVMNGIYVLENGPACMIKLPKEEQGGGCLWDFAAIACIFHELELPATNYEGTQLDLNRADSSYMNHEGVFFSNLFLTKQL